MPEQKEFAVIQAQAGIQAFEASETWDIWTSAFAGVTDAAGSTPKWWLQQSGTSTKFSTDLKNQSNCGERQTVACVCPRVLH